MRILVVDDEQLLVKGIKFNLENDGYEVLTADKNAAARKYPDLTLDSAALEDVMLLMIKGETV